MKNYKIKLVNCTDSSVILEANTWAEIGREYILLDGGINVIFDRDRDKFGRFMSGVMAYICKNGGRISDLGWHVNSKAAFERWGELALEKDFCFAG